MELQQFVKDALIAIQNGCQEGATDKTKAGQPKSHIEGARGIEFDLGIKFDKGKISVAGSGDLEGRSRLRFYVPIDEKE